MRYSVLGPVAAVHPHGIDTIARSRDRTVLAALLVDAGRVVSVPTLIDRVWGAKAGVATLSSLHAAISRLRKHLPGTDISTEPPGYRIALTPQDLDAGRFATLLIEARRAFTAGEAEGARDLLAEGLALWRGDPYADVRAPFVEQEAARLWDLRLAAVELQAEVGLQVGDDLDLTARLPALVSAHPLREGLCASLMLALYRTGRQANALELYEQTRQHFADDLGVDPSPDLQRLHTRMLRHDPELASKPQPDSAPVHRSTASVPAPTSQDVGVTAVLIGRDEEALRIEAAWQRAASGNATTLVVSGEAGIGKTRLIEEVALKEGEAGGTAAWGRCMDGGDQSAYWPWAEALTALAAQRGGERVRAALTGRGSPAAALLLERPAAVPLPTADDGPVGARQRLFDGVTAFLSALADDGPVLVVLEDLQWADEETVLLTEHVMTSLTAASLLLAITIRDPDESGRSVGRDLLAAAGRVPGSVQIALRGLDLPSVREFAGARLARQIDDDAAGRLLRRTDGNPFFISELVRLLADERAATGRAALDVPKTVQAVLERRFVHLSDDARLVLGAAAVLGREVDVRILAAVLARRPLDIADAIDAASAAGVLAATASGRLRFTHAIVQETLLAGLGPMRRSALHAQAAEAIEAAAGDAAAADLARHLLAAGAVGDPRKAVRFSILAASTARARAAYGEAEAHLRRAIETIATDPGSAAAELELEARTRLAELLTLTLGYNADAVVQERRRSFRLAVEVGTAPQLLSALRGAWSIALVSGDLPEAESLALQMGAAGTAHEDSTLLLAHDVSLGQVRWHQGRLLEARDLLRSAVDGAHRLGDSVRPDGFVQHPAASSRALLAVVLTLIGDTDEADSISGDAWRVTRALDHAFTTAYLSVVESWRAVWRHRPEEALRLSTEGLALATEHGFDQLVVACLGSHGWARLASGDPVGAAPELRRSIEVVESQAAGHMFGTLFHGVLAETLLALDHAGEAVREAEKALAEAARTGDVFFLPAVHLVYAAAQQRSGEAPASVDAHLDSAARIAKQQGAGLWVNQVAEARAGRTWSSARTAST